VKIEKQKNKHSMKIFDRYISVYVAAVQFAL